IDVGNRPLFRLSRGDADAVNDAIQLARCVLEISEDAALRRTHADARGQQLILDAVRAEVAFFGGVRPWIDEELIVRARDHAGSAADARGAVQIDDAVAALEQRVGRTDARARRLIALIAQDGEEETPRVRKRP